MSSISEIYDGGIYTSQTYAKSWDLLYELVRIWQFQIPAQ